MDIFLIIDTQEQIDYYAEEIKTEEDLKEFIKNLRPYLEISDKELNLFIEYYKSRDKNIILNYVSKQIREMSDEEKIRMMLDISSPWNRTEGKEVLELLFLSVQDKNKILDQYQFMSGKYMEQIILNNFDNKFFAEYIKKDCRNKSYIIQFLLDKGKATDIFNEMSEVDKTNFFMEYLAPRSGWIKASEFVDRAIHEIKDDYCRKILIMYVRTEAVVEVKEFQKITLKYQEIKEQIEQIEDENEKVDFIINLEDNDLKLEFLKQINAKENRDKVIKSLSKEVDPRIEEQVKLVQKMIEEFFEDKMGEKLTEEQREKLKIAFAKTSVNFDNLEESVNGRAYHLYDSVSISTRHLNNPSKTILFLLHEYGHILSYQNFKKDNYTPNHDVEEGMQDLFSELVTNYYIEKHGRIDLNGRRIRMDYPCKSYSSYDNENSWTRTMLYPLEKQGKDIDAITEYLLGDKNKFLEMTLGKENAETKPSDLFGNRYINTSWKELYEQMPEGFENQDITSSIYGRRNDFLPIFILQKTLEETGVDFFSLEGGRKYNCDFIADKYFAGRKLYEISKEEMVEFRNLYIKQKEQVVFAYDRFLNKMINELTEEEILQYSTEILSSSLALVDGITVIGGNLEKIWSLALRKERENIDDGQSVKDSADKYRKFINSYSSLLSSVKGDASEFIMDGVQDLKYAYLEQMEEAIRSGNIQSVLKGLTNNEDGTIYTDADILNLFETLGVKIGQIQILGANYKSQDIVDSAIRAKIRLDDVKRVTLILENDRSDEIIGERNND